MIYICPFIHLWYVVCRELRNLVRFLYKNKNLCVYIYIYIFKWSLSIGILVCSSGFCRCFVFGCRSSKSKDPATEDQNVGCVNYDRYKDDRDHLCFEFLFVCYVCWHIRTYRNACMHDNLSNPSFFFSLFFRLPSIVSGQHYIYNTRIYCIIDLAICLRLRMVEVRMQ